MAITKLISEEIPYVSPLETAKNALRIMDDNKLEHLPVVSEGMEYVGLVSEQQLLDVGANTLIESLTADRPSATLSNDIYSILSIMSQFHYSILPIIDNSNKYLGCITRSTLIDEMAEMTSAHTPGGVIEIETDALNFSRAVISNVTEYNSMKVVSMLAQPQGAHGIKAVLKLNGQETTSVIQGLERNGYKIRNVHNGDSKYNDMLEEHYDALIKYMEV